MSQSRSDSGQSMEEILASIRRIIAEGEREAQVGVDPGERVQSEGAAESAPAAEPGPPSAAERDVLVLTEMVQDDGSVVSLHSGAGVASAPPSADTLAPATAEPWPIPPDIQPAVDIELTVERAATVIAAAAPPPPEPIVSTEPVPATPIAAAPVAAVLARDGWAELSTKTSLAEERIAVPAEGPKRSEIVSEEALAASTAALSQLAQSVSRTREPAPGQSKTVEELVREAVEPMLKQWLDANLSRIVERMVREAIDRVVRRVE